MIRDRSQTLRPPQFSRTKSVGGVARAKTLGFRAKSQPVQRMRTFDASGMEEIVHDVVISPELFGNVLSYRILITCVAVAFLASLVNIWYMWYVFDPSGSQYQASSDTKDPYAFPVENSYYNDLLITEEQLRFRVNQTCPMNATSLDAFILALATDLAESISISASRIVIKDVIDVAPDTLVVLKMRGPGVTAEVSAGDAYGAIEAQAADTSSTLRSRDTAGLIIGTTLRILCNGDEYKIAC